MTKTAATLIDDHRQGGERVSVEGLSIFYRQAGADDGIPIVLTHGIPRSSFLYRNMIPILAERHPVRAWDLYGFGLSDKPRTPSRYHFAEFERFLGEFLKTIGVPRMHLVCHDVGGPFSIGYALRNPDKIETLTILNTTVFIKGFTIPRPVLLSITLPLMLHRLVMSDDRFTNWFLKAIQNEALQNPEALAGAEAEAWKELLCRDDGRLSFVRTIKAYRTALPYLRGIQKTLPDFKRPTLVLWGQHDPFCTMPTTKLFSDQIPDCEVQTIEHASHFLQEDAPEDTCKAILDFIEHKRN